MKRASTIQTFRSGSRVLKIQKEDGGTFRVVLLGRPAPNGPLRVEEQERGIPYEYFAWQIYRRAMRSLREERLEGK